MKTTAQSRRWVAAMNANDRALSAPYHGHAQARKPNGP